MAMIAEGDDAWSEGAGGEGANASTGGQAGPVDGGLASGELKAGRLEVHRGGAGRRVADRTFCPFSRTSNFLSKLRTLR